MTPESPWLPSSRVRWPYLTWGDYEPPTEDPPASGTEVDGLPNMLGTWDESGHHLAHHEWLLMKRAVMPGEHEARVVVAGPVGGWLGWALFGAIAGGALVAVALSGG